MTTSGGGCSAAARRAAAPSPASTTAWPCAVRLMRRVRRRCGSSSTTRTRLTGPGPASVPPAARTIVSPPPGVSSASSVPPMASVKPRDVQASPTPSRAGRRDAGTARTAGRAACGARPARCRRRAARRGRRRRWRGRPPSPPAVAQGVVDEVRHDPLGETDVGEDVGQVLADVDQHPVRGGVDAGQRRGDHLVEPHRLGDGRDRPGRQTGGVEEVVDEPREPVDGLLDGRQQLLAVGGGHAQRGVAQAPRGRLDRRQRGAQVVTDGRQQRGAHPGGVGAALRVGGLGGHPPVAQGEQRLTTDGGEERTLARGEGAAGADEVHTLVDLHVGVRVGGFRARRTPGARGDLPALLRAPFHEGHHHHRADREGVLRLGDRERVQRRGQEDRRSTTAGLVSPRRGDGRAGRGVGAVGPRLPPRGSPRADVDAAGLGDRRGADPGVDQRARTASAATSRGRAGWRSRCGRTRAAWPARRRRPPCGTTPPRPRRGDASRDRPTTPSPRPSPSPYGRTAARYSGDPLRLGASRARGRRTVALSGPPVTSATTTRSRAPFVDLSWISSAVRQALERCPTPGSREIPQKRELLGPPLGSRGWKKCASEASIFSGRYAAVRHVLAQGLRGDVDEPRSGRWRAPRRPGIRLALTHPGDAFDDVAQRLEVLDVDRRDHVDPGGAAAPRRPARRFSWREPGASQRRELVDHADLGCPASMVFDVELVQLGAAVPRTCGGGPQAPRAAPRCAPARGSRRGRDDDVRAPLEAAVGLVQRGVGLADAGCRPGGCAAHHVVGNHSEDTSSSCTSADPRAAATRAASSAGTSTCGSPARRAIARRWRRRRARGRGPPEPGDAGDAGHLQFRVRRADLRVEPGARLRRARPGDDGGVDTLASGDGGPALRHCWCPGPPAAAPRSEAAGGGRVGGAEVGEHRLVGRRRRRPRVEPRVGGRVRRDGSMPRGRTSGREGALSARVLSPGRRAYTS